MQCLWDEVHYYDGVKDCFKGIEFFWFFLDFALNALSVSAVTLVVRDVTGLPKALHGHENPLCEPRVQGVRALQ